VYYKKSNRQETKEKKKTEENALVEKKKTEKKSYVSRVTINMGKIRRKKPVEGEHKKQVKITITYKTLKGGKKEIK
jgi:hypothetical protein